VLEFWKGPKQPYPEQLPAAEILVGSTLGVCVPDTTTTTKVVPSSVVVKLDCGPADTEDETNVGVVAEADIFVGTAVPRGSVLSPAGAEDEVTGELERAVSALEGMTSVEDMVRTSGE
jgi:hypothetical protein